MKSRSAAPSALRLGGWPDRAASAGAVAIAARLTLEEQLWVRGVGDSMAPIIRDGDRILLRPVRAATLRRGDVVGVLVSGNAIAHRIERVLSDSRLETRGDARLASESPVSRDSVLGLAVLVERGRRRIALRGTLEFGVGAYLLGRFYALRLTTARGWRSAKRLVSSVTFHR